MALLTELNSSDIHRLCHGYLRERRRHEEKASRDAFKVVHYKWETASDVPTGFLAYHRILCVRIAHDCDQTEETVYFFIKSAPAAVSSRLKYVNDFRVFEKEVLVYREIMPRLQAAFADVAPKCYYATPNHLVFKNLAHCGFRMATGRDGRLDYDHLHCALKTLAALHASSIVCEVSANRKLPELFPGVLAENAYPRDVADDHMRVQNFNNANKVLCEMVRGLPQYEHCVAFVLDALPQRMRIIFELARTSSKYRNVFSHGDLWANNIMFRYGKFGEIPIECQFVDFQLARYAPPILDVITILTIPTTRAFRDSHLAELLCDYYRFLQMFLQCKGVNIDDIITRQEFFASADEFRIAGLIESCLFSHLTALPSQLTLQLTASADGFDDFFARRRVDICMEAFNTDQLYRDKMSDTLQDLIDNFILSKEHK